MTSIDDFQYILVQSRKELTALPQVADSIEDIKQPIEEQLACVKMAIDTAAEKREYLKQLVEY